MQDLPHHYQVTAIASPSGNVDLTSAGLETINSAPPAEYGGPGNLWSPETLLVSAVADCFILTFRAIARASKFSWVSLTCSVTGTLARKEGKTLFTEYSIVATLSVAGMGLEDKALKLLEKAEAGCLITSSLAGETHLQCEVVMAD